MEKVHLELLRLQKKFDRLAKNTRTVVWEVDLKGRYTYVNHVAEHLYKYTNNEFIDKLSIFDLHPISGRSAFKTKILDIFTQQEVRRHLIHAVVPNEGTLVWVSTDFAPILDDNNELTGYQGWDTDITDSLKANETLKVTKDRHKSIFNNIPISIMNVDKDGLITDVNPYHIKNIIQNRATREDYIGRSILWLPNIKRAGLSGKYLEVLKGNILSLQSIYFPPPKNGEGKYYNIKGVPVFENGGVVGAVFTHEDITERIQIEKDREHLILDYGKRVKELSCLYNIAKLIETPDIDSVAVMQGTVELIPPAWQYPEITRAKIRHYDKEYLSPDFMESKWKQCSEIIVNSKPVGYVEVFYIKEMCTLNEGPFLKEERFLINAIAERLSRITELKQAESKLKEYAKSQEMLVREVNHRV